jgi:hypothetical protein
MDPRIVSVLTFWSHSGAYLLVVPVIAVAVVVVIRSLRELARVAVATDAALLRRLRRRVVVWSVAAVAGLVGFVTGLGHFGCAVIMAHQSRCIANVKDLARGLLLYSYDHDGPFPPANAWSDIPQLRGKDGALRCPAAQSPYGYGMNRAVGCVDLGIVEEPAITVLLFEGDARARSFSGGEGDLATGRHSGAEIYGFLDGHATWKSRDSAPPPVWLPKLLETETVPTKGPTSTRPPGT